MIASEENYRNVSYMALPKFEVSLSYKLNDTLFFWRIRGEMMNFGADTWWIICTITTVVIAIIGFFLKRTMNTQDTHSKDINRIKLTYVTKEELKESKEGLSADIKLTQADVKEIKEQMLSKQDYYRLQTQTEQKIDKIYDLLLKQRGDYNGK